MEEVTSNEDLGFTNINIIKVLKTEPQALSNEVLVSTTNYFSDESLVKELSELGVCLRYLSASDVYNVVKKIIKTEESIYNQKLMDKYGLTEGMPENDVANHQEFENIKKEGMKISLYNSHGYRNINLKYGCRSISFEYTETELEAIKEVCEIDCIVPLIFIRKMKKDRTGLCFVKIDEEKNMFDSITFNLKFNLFDDTDDRQVRFKSIISESLEKLDYDSLNESHDMNCLETLDYDSLNESEKLDCWDGFMVYIWVSVVLGVLCAVWNSL